MFPEESIPEDDISSAVANLPFLPIPPTLSSAKMTQHLESVFGAVTKQSKDKTAIYRTQLRAKYGATLHLLETLGSVCGACLVAKFPDPQSHNVNLCPSLNIQHVQQYKALQKALHYTKMKHMPCFVCHIPSGGRDEFHPSYGEACPNPYLALPMAYYIWIEPTLKKTAMKELDITPKHWEDLEAFALWYAEDDPQYFTKSMLLMQWVSERVLGFCTK